MTNGYYFTSSQGKRTDDEFYTLASDVREILRPFDLSNKRVYCPCDTEKSAWVQYLRGRCSLIRTADDYHNHKRFFKWADIIITNPPFTHFADFARWCVTYTGECILITPSHSVFTFWTQRTDGRDFRLLKYTRYFLSPDGRKRECNAGAVYYYGGKRNLLGEGALF